MAKTVVSLFRTYEAAKGVIGRLETDNIPSDAISLVANRAEDRYWRDANRAPGAPDARSADAIADWLESEGAPEADACSYGEGVRRGGALVAVKCADDEAQRVAKILDGDNVVDMDERETAWRAEGWTARRRTAAAGAAPASAARAGSGAEREQVIPVAEERLRVGKREVEHGRVRIHTHVVTKPVQEQVRLHEEHVSVERRPADRPLTDRPGDLGAGELFKDRTVEMSETSEEPVVSKEARVREEVVVRKDVKDRTETVFDQVRRTEVEVEDERGNAETGTIDRRRTGRT